MDTIYNQTKLVFCSLIRGNFEFKKDNKEIDVIDGIPQDNTPQKQNEIEIENKNNTTTNKIEKQIPGRPEEVFAIKKGRLKNIKKFWNHLSATGKSKNTIKEYRYDSNWWFKKAQDINKKSLSIKRC